MSKYTMSFRLSIAAQLLAWGLCLPVALQAQQAVPAAASVNPAATPSSHDAAIIRLRDVAYGKDEDGNYHEQSVRVREAAKEALKQVVIQQIREEEEAKVSTNSQTATATSGSNSVTATNFNQAAAAPAGTNTGDAIPAAPETPSRSRGSSAANENWFLPELFNGAGGNKLMNFETGFSPMQTFGVSPNQPFSPGQIGPGGGGGTGSDLAPQLGGDIGSINPAAVPPGPGSSVSTNSADAGAPSSVAGFLRDSDSVQEVKVQERSGVSLDPHIRAYKWGQIYADVDGAYWSPARLDMDTMLSKIDPGMVSSVNVLSGPYGVRYGPGFAFLDVNRIPTPRYECPETHLDSMLNVRSNGGQVYGRETVYGGGESWGYRGSYGEKEGSDYRAGDGSLIPASYHSRDAWGEFGYDLDPHQRINILYQRMDQTNVENPAQFFGTSYLGSYGFQAGYVNDAPTAPWSKLNAAAWYNSTRFNGDTRPSYNPNFPVMQFVNAALDEELGGTNALIGQTQGHAYSSGGRMGVTFGDQGCTQLRTGGDFRYLGQVIGEEYQILSLDSETIDFNTNMPHSRMIDPGVYAELSQPVTKNWTVSVGTRVDYVRTEVNPNDLRLDGLLLGGGTPSNLLQNDILYAFYAMNKVKLGEHWVLDAGFGQAQRPPTLMERYSDGLFVSTLQSGFTRMIGDPNLRPERNWQFDVGLSSNYETMHSKARFFQSWIQDYVTYAGSSVETPLFTDARLLYFTNTSLATLTGFELAADCDWSANFTPFAKMSYVYGWDQEINAPLTGISPLEGTIGLRIHDANHGRVWGIEPSLRLVADQNHVGAIRSPDITNTVIVEEVTPSFVVCNLRGYYNYTKNLSIVGGVDNVFNKNYQEHLDLRLNGPQGTPYQGVVTRVLEAGISPYFGINWTF
ncbi:MAG: TonB-dependent receptor [Planctomycetota bacterium]